MRVYSRPKRLLRRTHSMIRSYLVDVRTKQVHLLQLGLNRVGRETSVEVVIRGLGLSRSHCALVAEAGGRILLNDLGSKNGTHLEGQQIHSTVEVTPGQILQVGSKCFRVAQFELSPDPEEQPALVLSPALFAALCAERRLSA
jgi:pSer/pThr/pTyr-binding forkhead associated (FHA) protein